MEITDLKDMTGWPIVIGGRVRVTTLTLKSGRNVYAHGQVTGIKDGYLEIRLFKNLNMITAAPERCQVMKGKTRNSFQYELIQEKFKRKR